MKVRVVKSYLIEVDYVEYSRLTYALHEYVMQNPAPDNKDEIKQLRDVLYRHVWAGCLPDCTSKEHDHPPAKETKVD